MTDSTTTFGEIEAALAVANQELPLLLNAIGTFYPPIGAIAKFLPLIQVALQGVQTVQQAMGPSATTQVATAAVVEHLTPGAPAAPALN